MPTYFKSGAFIDQLSCDYCKRMYRGDTRTVNKLMSLHMLKEHGITKKTFNNKPDVVTYTINHKNEY